jgi:hypothetical protein
VPSPWRGDRGGRLPFQGVNALGTDSRGIAANCFATQTLANLPRPFRTSSLFMPASFDCTTRNHRHGRKRHVWAAFRGAHQS